MAYFFDASGNQLIKNDHEKANDILVAACLRNNILFLYDQ
jgi:hypothetical protein